MLHRINHYLSTGDVLPEPTVIERLDMALYHCKKLVEFLGEHHGICHSRKFFGWYIKYVHGAPRYRAQLMQIVKFDEIERLINHIKYNAELEQMQKIDSK